MRPDSPPDIPFVTGRVEPGGRTFDAWKHQTLLDSMEQGGLQWPSSCRSGTCRTCLSTLLSGRVRYEMAWPGMTPEEKAEGCVLPCVALPVTDVVLKDPFSD
jgi:ferredoxin